MMINDDLTSQNKNKMQDASPRKKRAGAKQILLIPSEIGYPTSYTYNHLLLGI